MMAGFFGGEGFVLQRLTGKGDAFVKARYATVRYGKDDAFVKARYGTVRYGRERRADVLVMVPCCSQSDRPCRLQARACSVE